LKIFINPEIEAIISKHCAETKIRKDFSSHYSYVVSNIYIRPYTDKRIENSDFVPVNKELLRKLISKQETEIIIDNLVKLDILETDNIYIIGKKSRCYKINDKSTLKWKLEEMKDNKLAEKLTLKHEARIESVIGHGEGYRIVNYWFKLLEMDVDKSKKYISNHFRGDKDKYDSAFCSINLFKHEMKFISVDNTSNRLHCNLTNLDSKLRQFLTIDGEKLAQVDISNSQPLFLGMVMKNKAMVETAELSGYLGLVCSGKFYEYLADKMPGKPLDLKDDVVRKKFKKSIFSGVLFDENRVKLSKYELLFQKEFPTIFTEIRKTKAKNYNAMAIMLQKMESQFIFDAVAVIDREIGKGKAPLLTIHDSIVSTSEYIDIVQQIMEHLFQEEFGLLPSLKATKF
jgi:hypothetical protein